MYQFQNGKSHVSSSTEDLMTLFKAEIETLQFLNRSRYLPNKPNYELNGLISKYLKLIDFNL